MEFSLLKPQAHMWANWPSYVDRTDNRPMESGLPDCWTLEQMNHSIKLPVFLYSTFLFSVISSKSQDKDVERLIILAHAVNNVYDIISSWYDIVLTFSKTRLGNNHGFVLNSVALFESLCIWLLILCEENKYLFSGFFDTGWHPP